MTCPSAPRVHDAGRRALAWWATVLWVVGFELMPNAHLGLHGQLGAHSHAGVVVAQEHEHEHEHEHDHHHHDDAGHHEHESEPVAPPGRELETPSELVGDHAVVHALDLDHGQHDLLHRGIAVVQPPDPLPGLACAPAVWLERGPVRDDQLRSRAVTRPRARGPPATRTCRSVDAAT